MSNANLLRVRRAIVDVALLQEALLGKRSSVTGDVAEIDAAILLEMSDAEFGDLHAGRLNTPGYDLYFRGLKYQVKAVRWSSKNPVTARATARIKAGGFDMLLIYLYNEDFTVRDLFRLSAREWGECQKSRDGRATFAALSQFKVAR